MKLEDLIKLGTDDTGDEPVVTMESVLTVVETIEELKSMDILYKLSAISGEVLQKMVQKASSIKLLEIEDDAVDDYFNDDEKGFIYGCYLMANVVAEEQPEPLESPTASASLLLNASIKGQ